MLHNVLIQKANQFADVNKQGRFINVVLAAGTITVRIQFLSGQVEQTEMVSGMALEMPDKFEKVSITSDTAQQCKVWVSMLPLTYSPIESKTVGSSAVKSSLGRVFSGEPTVMLLEETGRNKVTISPASDIKIGGAGVGSKTGIPVKAGEVFQLNTQGAIYAFEESGAYPASYTASYTAEQAQNPVTKNNSYAWMLFIPTKQGDEVLVYSAGTTITRKKISDWSDIGNISVDTSPSEYFAKEYNGKMIYTGGTIWQEIDLETLVATSENLPAGGSYRRFAAFNDKRVAFDATNNKVAVSIDGGAWATGATTTGVTGSTYACEVDSAGNIYIAYENQVAKSGDNGNTWSVLTAPSLTAKENGLAVDLSNDYIYLVSGNYLYRSVDGGVTWVIVSSYTNYTSVVTNQGVILAAGSNGYTLYDGSNWLNVAYTGSQTQQRSANIGTDGRIYIGYRFETLLIEGSKVPAGGVEVAIMSEVN